MNTILITGANRGIGLGLVKEYAQAGWQVLAACRHPESADELNALAVKKPYNRIKILKLDVSDENGIKQLGHELAEVTIDILINNAGILMDPRDGQFRKQIGKLQQTTLIENFKINAVGPLLLTQALIESLSKSSKPLVINISSSLGSIGNNVEGGVYGYRASKAALNAFMKNLAIELLDRNITVVALNPGWVKTDMGGKNAEITVEESVSKMHKLISEFGIVDTGKFFNYTGDEIEW